MLLDKLAKRWSKFLGDMEGVSDLDRSIQEYSDASLESMREYKNDLEKERRKLIERNANIVIKVSEANEMIKRMEEAVEPAIIKMTEERVQMRVDITRLLNERKELHHGLTAVRTNLRTAINNNDKSDRLESLQASEVVITVKLMKNANKLKALGVTHHNGVEL